MATQPEKHGLQGEIEEHYYRRGDIDFCFLLNRTHHNLRVFDYRVGNYQQKRDFFDRIARAEGLKKVFTVVEKQDSKSWRSVGFSREGAIPGYFRTADAYVMSRVYTEDGDPIQGGAPKVNAPANPAKLGKVEKPKGVNSDVVHDETKLEKAARKRVELAVYAPFRRHVFHPDVGVQAKIGKREIWAGAETDSSFGHAKVDLLTPPESEEDLPAMIYTMTTLLHQLVRMDTASVFAMVPVDWKLSAQVYSELGFKVSARLTDHVMRQNDFISIQLWHRRIGKNVQPKLPEFE